MLADLDQRLIFQPEIATTNLRPDIVLWSGSAHIVQLIDLTVPWEDAVDPFCLPFCHHNLKPESDLPESYIALPQE